jgi:hypothetical protein
VLLWRLCCGAGDFENKIYTQAQLEELCATREQEYVAGVLWGGYMHDPAQVFIQLVDGGHVRCTSLHNTASQPAHVRANVAATKCADR